MKRYFHWVLATALALLFVAGITASVTATVPEVPVVGRISHVEGQVLCNSLHSQDWMPIWKDTPFGMKDAIYSDAAGHAEFIIPNGISFRIGANTHIQAVALKRDASEVDIGCGIARFYNKNLGGAIKATTPFGYVLAESEAVFDVYVGDQSVEVIVLDGSADIVQPARNARYTIPPGQSIIANRNQLVSGDGTVDAAWDDWNGARDIPSSRTGRSKHLPRDIGDCAADLEENGKWERVYYDGGYREMWRPTSVPATWRPFTRGCWTDWNGEKVWVPDETFGYVTHHYGNWVGVNADWYWEPPTEERSAGNDYPGCAWNPGRVAWVSGESEVGWIPLAPTEAYYAHNYWGPMTVVLEDSMPLPDVAAGGWAFHRSAVIVPRERFYSARNYQTVLSKDIHPDALANRFHPAADVNKIVEKNAGQDGRYRSANSSETPRPSRDFLGRVENNRRTGSGNATEVSAAGFRQAVSSARTIEPGKQAITRPKLTGGSVPPDRASSQNVQAGARGAEANRKVKPAVASSAFGKGQPDQERQRIGTQGTLLQNQAFPGMRPQDPGLRPMPGKAVTQQGQGPTQVPNAASPMMQSGTAGQPQTPPAAGVQHYPASAQEGQARGREAQATRSYQPGSPPVAGPPGARSGAPHAQSAEKILVPKSSVSAGQATDTRPGTAGMGINPPAAPAGPASTPHAQGGVAAPARQPENVRTTTSPLGPVGQGASPEATRQGNQPLPGNVTRGPDSATKPGTSPEVQRQGAAPGMRGQGTQPTGTVQPSRTDRAPVTARPEQGASPGMTRQGAQPQQIQSRHPPARQSPNVRQTGPSAQQPAPKVQQAAPRAPAPAPKSQPQPSKKPGEK
ncbi:MAG: hypothetical protein LLG06_07445 [Desulfobacteraceae bacterium]|nr:hypothetical protein [Desulfobacteraceae bacterium]